MTTTESTEHPTPEAGEQPAASPSDTANHAAEPSTNGQAASEASSGAHAEANEGGIPGEGEGDTGDPEGG
ncbi:MAG TPA: hypothetical protein VIY73_20440, partial [Polyangiaceae bacterium]